MSASHFFGFDELIFKFRSMLQLVLLAVSCNGLIEDTNFSVTKCNNDDGQPELTFTVDSKYFEDNLSWLTDQVDFNNKK